MPRKYFPFYFTFREAGKTMPPRLRATFYEAIIDYATTGVEPVLPSSISGCWAVVKPLLDTSQKRYNAGVNGGRPSKNDSFGFPDSETNGLHKEKEKEKEKEKKRRRKRMRGRMKKRRRAKPLPRLARLILPRRIFSQPLPMVTASCCRPFRTMTVCAKKSARA